MREPLPPWEPSFSDGCSIPDFLKPLFKLTPKQAEGCVEHDRSYYYGGTKRQRLEADVKLMFWWIDHGKSIEEAEMGFNMVRRFGGPDGRNPKYSWAFGGKRFVYDKE